MVTPSSVRKHPEIFCWTDDSCADRAQPGCYQTGPQNRAGNGAPSISPERSDPADCAPGFAWTAQVFASRVRISSAVGEADWPGSLLPAVHHSDGANVPAPAVPGCFGPGLSRARPPLSSKAAGLSSGVPTAAGVVLQRRSAPAGDGRCTRPG